MKNNTNRSLDEDQELEELEKLIIEGEQEKRKLKLHNNFSNENENDRPLAKYFYSVSNHCEFYQIGNSFLKDFKEGAKSFAITSTGYKAAQQRTILALASFFDHVKSMKIAIVTNQMVNGAFHDLVSASRPAGLILPVIPSKSIAVERFYHHFDFVSFDEILKLAPKGTPNFEYEHSIAEFVKHYDLIFWDIPELDTLKANHNLYYPIALYFDSLSIIVSHSLSKSKEIEELQKFFTNYGVNLKGFLLDYTTQTTHKKSLLDTILRR
ncbi:MAG: hypothetical protein ACOYL6_00045 [Bacteriovoracaceae bacterium]